MTKYLDVTFSDGNEFLVPATVVAEERAAYFAGVDAARDFDSTTASYKEIFDRVYKEELEYTIGDNFELKDWAWNNMDWQDVKNQAIHLTPKIRRVSNFYDEWVNVDIAIRELSDARVQELTTEPE